MSSRRKTMTLSSFILYRPVAMTCTLWELGLGGGDERIT
jgi:hypothetical protein